MVFKLHISEAVLKKIIQKHSVTVSEIEECFFNRSGGLLEDTREQHRTKPSTMWFVAQTNEGRLLKVVFVALPNGAIEIKTAYEPNQQEVTIYEKYA